ncbi:hypothetical protein MJA45_07695 [Paenibacillus aurantius]|uniref:Glycosyl hydrolase family 32 N-terminal domain-containing protein n=1 Tax=Paenibacillus aurantius TaxID=2918900 RepID=A0AA96LIU5_9BACL|nr:hypothetical protein [Paenibacillus aurantius]WNQ12905.1 hypothetical protein MJA45_07695 [Paenibacillus aurantius]
MKKPQLENYLTPHKYGKPVLTGSGVSGAFDSHSVDCPFVFRHHNQFYMMYIGFDGLGYQTALACSQDLLHWEHLAVILKREEQSARWDSIGAAGNWILKESNNLNDLPVLKKVQGRYWMVYHSYPGVGYESGPAEIGLAWCEEESLLHWNRLEHPVFSWKEGEDWERGGLYKACLIEHEQRYYLFYNAKDDIPGQWSEQTGAAVSTDLMNWQRLKNNPLLPVSPGRWDSYFVSDPFIVQDQGVWLNFYFGYDKRHAQEGLAYSTDLIHWHKVEHPIIEHGNRGTLDETHAHKASIVRYDGVLYHFYCSVRPYAKGDITGETTNEFRCITLAASRSL